MAPEVVETIVDFDTDQVVEIHEVPSGFDVVLYTGGSGPDLSSLRATAPTTIRQWSPNYELAADRAERLLG